MWSEMLRVFRQNVAPYLGIGIILGAIVGLIFGSAWNGLITGATIGAVLSNLSLYRYKRGYQFMIGLIAGIGVGIMYGTMFRNVSMGILLGSVIPAALELIPLPKRRREDSSHTPSA